MYWLYLIIFLIGIGQICIHVYFFANHMKLKCTWALLDTPAGKLNILAGMGWEREKQPLTSRRQHGTISWPSSHSWALVSCGTWPLPENISLRQGHSVTAMDQNKNKTIPSHLNTDRTSTLSKPQNAKHVPLLADKSDTCFSPHYSCSLSLSLLSL